jgi:hypothetical protein
MPRFTSRGPPADGGYPIDSDLHQMTDDGGPQTPDPARWSDPDWRDNIGDQDTFAAEVAMGFPAASRPGVVTVRTPFQLPTTRLFSSKPWHKSASRESPRQMTMLPGGGSSVRAR